MPPRVEVLARCIACAAALCVASCRPAERSLLDLGAPDILPARLQAAARDMPATIEARGPSWEDPLDSSHDNPAAGPAAWKRNWPIVTIDARSISVEGDSVRHAPLGEHVYPIESLALKLAARRKAWMVEHPGAAFPGVAGARVSAYASLSAHKFAFATLAAAGFPSVYVTAPWDPYLVIELVAHGRWDWATRRAWAQLAEGFALQVRVQREAVELSWSHEGRTLRIVETVPRSGQLPADAICAAWHSHGVHREPTDARRDMLMLDASKDTAFVDLLRVAAQAAECTREQIAPDETRRRVPVFWMVLMRG